MNKKCKKCFIIKPYTSFYKSKGGIGDVRARCKVCCDKEYKDWRRNGGLEIVKNNNNKYYHQNKNSVEYRYLRLKTGSKQRHKELDITLAQFKTLWNLPCKYCGDRVTTAGLDRVDSSVGYTMNNIVRCCEICNRAKNNLSVDDFISHCRKIIKKYDSDSETK